jgi:hypothetical protein
MRPALTLVLTLLAATPAAAQAPGGQAPLKKDIPYFVPPPPRRPQDRPPPAPLLSPLPDRASHSGLPDPAPRLGGFVEPRGAGATCRTTCSNDYFVCLRRDEMSDCGPVWALCQAECPGSSSED